MLLFRAQRPSKINEFVQANDPPAVGGTPGDSWRKYLTRHSGIGETMYDLEQSYLAAQGGFGSVISALWSTFLTTLGIITGTLPERMRVFLKYVFGTNKSYLLQEDNLSKITLEDGSGKIILE